MKSPLVSIIVPVYGVEKYLDRCVQSILRQTYENVEIILVDDGSPDSCGKMCDEYAAKFSNVFCVHKENGGLSSARNAGMREAHGDYVGFVDSDDWIAEDMYECLVDMCVKYDCEAAQISYKMAYREECEIKQPHEKISLYEGKDILQHYLVESTKIGSYSVWKCLFRKSILEGLLFREGKINEDIDFKYKALFRCCKFAVSNQIKYFYFQSTGSITTAGLRKRDFQLYEAANLLADLTSVESYGSIAKLGRVKKARTAFSLLSRIAYYGYSDEIDDRKKIETDLIAEHRANVLVLLCAPIPMSRKLLTVLFALNFSLSKRFISLIKKVS